MQGTNRKLVQGDEIGQWVMNQIGGEWFSQGTYCIGEIRDGEIKSGVIFREYNGASISASIATVQNFSRSFISTILHYPFDLLKVNCIWITVSSGNEKSLKLVKRLGFRQQTKIPHAMRDGDMVIFSLRRKDCSKFMEKHHG